MSIADNTTAKAYDRLQKSIDWCEASDEAQLEVMLVMKQLLIEAPSWTPIFDFGGCCLISGAPHVRIAADQLGSVLRRITRFEATIKRSA